MPRTMNLETMNNFEAQESASSNVRVKYLTGLSKHGDQVNVQFIGIHSPEDIVGYAVHTVHLKNKQGGEYTRFISCLRNMNEDINKCPLCCHGKAGTNKFNRKYDEKKIDILSIFYMINLNKKYDSSSQQWVSISEPQVVNGANVLVNLEPELVKRENTSKRFRQRLVEFVRKNGDISNKVITIQMTRLDDKGKVSESTFDTDYVFGFNTMLQPVDEKQFIIPDINTVVIDKTYEEMDTYINTGSFYNQVTDDNVEQAFTPQPRVNTQIVNAQPAINNQPDVVYNSMPNVSYQRRAIE